MYKQPVTYRNFDLQTSNQAILVLSLKPMLCFGFIELLCVQQVENEKLESRLTTQPKGMKRTH